MFISLYVIYLQATAEESYIISYSTLVWAPIYIIIRQWELMSSTCTAIYYYVLRACDRRTVHGINVAAVGYLSIRFARPPPNVYIIKRDSDEIGVGRASRRRGGPRELI